MAATRRAEVVWEGDLMKGSGKVSSKGSGALVEQPVSWAARTESQDGKTSPEELLAAAHASCFSMALSARLGKAGTPPAKLVTSCTVTFDKLEAGWKVTKSEIEVTATVPGGDAAKLRELAEDAKNNCPISQALKGNVELKVTANLA